MNVPIFFDIPNRVTAWVGLDDRHRLTVGVGRCLVSLLAGTVFVLAPSVVQAGPWSQLPDAVERLAEDSENEAAERVLALVETSILREAQEGRLVATRTLFDTYASLVSGLPNGGFRLRVVERRVASRLLETGDRTRSTDFHRAAAAWGLAGELDPSSPAVERLREILMPPVDAEPGQVWRSPLDGAALVFHPAMAIRMGCTANDGGCRDNEIYFVWVEIPARWFESHEVSNRRYRLCVEAGACSEPEDPTAYRDVEQADHPVVGVSWRQARSYARWSGRRLPSEAEWERAARGEVVDMRFPWGNKRLRELANVWRDPRSGVAGGTTPVGRYPSMGFGMRDMAGNVWEWCEDRYRPRFSDDSTDGGAARNGLGRVVRGGSWRRAVDMARVSTRDWHDIGHFADDLGFRCVIDHDARRSPLDLVRIARRAFPVSAGPGRELIGAALEAEDRRYLERRALRLYVIEGRTREGLTPAARRLAVESSDPVARDIFVRFETEMLRLASGTGLSEVRRGLEAYQAAVDVAPRLTGRFASFQGELVEALRQTMSSHESRGDRATARQAAELARDLTGGSGVFTAAAERLGRATGTTRVWAGDGKGMVWIDSADFTMGAGPAENSANANERPEHRVVVEGFWIDRTEVTNDEYRGCVRAGICTPPQRPEFFDDPRLGSHPVISVDWFQARSYAAWAGKRLASEAEWELAARAGATTSFPWGDDWIPGNGNGMGIYRADQWNGTAPVASFPANAWGVYDLIGNASEWVDDVYNPSYQGAPRDGRPWHQETGLAGERRRVVRGGGYDDAPQRHRVTRRTDRRPDDFNRSVGFRCVADE